jgi:hypothetical protein
MALCFAFIGRLFHFTPFIRISNFIDLSITDETWVVGMRIWCIKIGNVLVLHSIRKEFDLHTIICVRRLTWRLIWQGSFHSRLHAVLRIFLLWLQRRSLAIQPSVRSDAVLWCVTHQSLHRPWHSDSAMLPLPAMYIGVTEGVISRQGMLTSPGHLIPPLLHSEVRVCRDAYFSWAPDPTSIIFRGPCL